MAKISCVVCGRVHERNYMCDAKAKRKALKNKENRNRVDSKIYNTDRWKKLRDNIIDEFSSIDLYSYYVLGKAVQAQTVHHIVEICADIDMAYDWDNLIPLSNHTHKIIHKLYKENNNIKKEIQILLLDMVSSWTKGDRSLGSYRERLDFIIQSNSGFITEYK